MLFACGKGPSAEVTLLNVSYDPTRELYDDINVAFAQHWKETAGQDVHINQSHGGSGKQARSVIDGLPADVVTLALAGDIDAIAAEGKLLPLNWEQRLPNNSAPYTSTIVFLVRKGNPKNIQDWGDLVRGRRGDHAESQDLRWCALELPRRVGVGLQQPGGTEASAREFVRALQERAGARHRCARLDHHLRATRHWRRCSPGKTRRCWRSASWARDKVEIVVPSISMLAEPSVAVVDKVVLRRGTREVAQAYPRIPLYAGRPGDHREELLSPA